MPPAPGLHRLRSITSRDRAGLTRFYAGLSPDSRAARFHGATPTIPETTARFFCGSDHRHREGIVAESVDASGEPMIIGHVCIEPLTDDAVEMAIAVADAWQHHGVGRAMLARAITWAQLQGMTRLAATMQCGNPAMFGLLRSMGYPITYGPPAGGSVDADLDLRIARHA
ncbi:MAG TPA: GNAT family N-acetyltransferase [Patescibacteria group bacterium]|nr:GNAT family N-acetyltransferase [Patescibacteria group bacterium]